MESQTRQEFIRAAVSFLQNPKLIDSPLQDKLKFLRDKGLSETELDEALNYALISRHQSQSGKWNFILVLGLCIGGYKLYQAYLSQKSMSKEEIPQKVEHRRRQEERNERTLVLDKETPTLNEIMDKMSELKKLIELQRSNFASDVQSLKTLLLGHEKFAAPPVIPAWQLAESEDKLDKNRDSD